MAKTEPNKEATDTTNTPNIPIRGAKVESTFADKWEPEAVGAVLEGRYLGFEIAEGRDGNFNAYQVAEVSGKRTSLAGAHLDSILPQVPRGTFVWVTFKGTRKVGKNEMRLFDVEIEQGVKLLEVMK